MKCLQRIIEYGLYLLVFLLPWQTRWIIRSGVINGGYSEYGTISLYAIDILLVVLIILNAVFYKNLIQDSVRQPADKIQNLTCWWLIAGLELMVFISIFFAPDKVLAVFSYLRFLLGVGLFWLIISANFSRLKLLGSFLAGVFIQAGLGIWQFVAQSGFANKWLGLAAHSSSELGASVIEVYQLGGFSERWLRAYGGLDHPNILGGVLVIALFLLINYYYQVFNFRPSRFVSRLEAGGSESDRFLIFKQFLNSKILKFFTFYFLLFTFVMALFLTFSRAAWLGAAVGLLIILGTAVAQKDLFKQKKLAEIVLVLGIFIFVLFNFYGDLVSTRLAGRARLEAKSNIERIESYQNSLSLVKEHWLLGVGIGNFTQSLQNELVMDRPAYYYQPAHNVFLLVFAEIGILGLLFFIALLIYPFFRQPMSGETAALLPAMLAMMLFDHWWWSLHFGVLFFWLLTGLLSREQQIKY